MKENRSIQATPVDQLVDILDHPEERIFPLFQRTNNSEDRRAKQKTQSELIGVAKHLFRGIEENARKYHEVCNEEQQGIDSENATIPPLSGLDELYVPGSEHDEDSKERQHLDVETLWGQVDLQNKALNKLIKMSTKRLAKAPEKIVLIDRDKIASSDEEYGDESSTDEYNLSKKEKIDDEATDEDDTLSEDEDAKRIRERMERSMEEAESEDEGDDDADKSEGEPRTSTTNGESKEKQEETYDPVAEGMKDGFFDLNDMEEYADEEEDYLPREAYAVTEAEKKKKQRQQEKHKKSFHQMQRDGDLLDRSDEEDEYGMDELYEEDTGPVKRKKYREDEDIDALYNLYQPANDDQNEAEDAANMTAAEFFGQPSRKHMERYNAKRAKEEIGDDDDSWGEYDFEQEQEGQDTIAQWGAAHEASQSEEDEREKSEAEEDVEDEYKQQPKTEETAASRKIDNSKHAKHQERLRKQTEQLESDLLSEKPWQMTGETKSTLRPVNSLLEGTPEFEMASKQAPTITVEHTANLEDVIKKRILAEDWDDVVPRELPDVGWHKKRGELPEVSQEKSKLGLGELYEREYLKKAVGYDKDAEEKKSEQDKAKDEMKQLFANLCSKLDGLSNYHFAPRPVANEADVRTATAPAIAMEEVLPLHVNDARSVAPEEVFGTKRGREGVLRGETETDQQERKRLRQSKKAARRKARKEKQADEKLVSRLEPGLGLNNPYEKRKAREELATARSRGKVSTGEKDADGKYGSSGTFFQRLQAEAKQNVHGHDGPSDDGAARKKRSKPKSSALKL